MEENRFEFKDIFIEVINEDKKINTKYARLLDGISGTFKSGGITAVLGASGAGKTTLFDVLVGKVENSSKTNGTILFNGKERTEEEWINKCSYVKQFDVFYPNFSIEEIMRFNTEFYHPHKSEEERFIFIEETLKMCCIFEKRHAAMESLSGGENKRAMIAVSLCGDPDIIFMDEPTSGLDSHSALTLVNFIKGYAERTKKIVVISLHQPGEALFNLCENIYFLGCGGVFYEGKLANILSWLEEKGMRKPEGMSLAEYLFELHSENPYPPEIIEYKPIVANIIENYRQRSNEIRLENNLKINLTHLIFTTDFSYQNMLTLWKRFYFHASKTPSLPISYVFRILFIVFWIFVLAYVLYIKIKKNAASADSGNTSFYENIKILRNSFTDDYFVIFSQEIFTSASFLLYFFIIAYIDDLLYYRYFLTEDICSGKYSTITCFVTYVLHNCISSVFWMSIIPLIVYLSPLRGFLYYTYLPKSILFALCCGLSITLLKHILFQSSIVVFYASIYILAQPDFIRTSLTLLLNLLAKKNENLLGWIKYLSYIHIFLPNIILLNIFRYKELISIKNLYLRGEKYFGKGYDNDTIRNLESSIFDFLQLEKLPPFWVCYLLLIISIILNFGAMSYLFWRQTKAYIRIKLN